MNRTKEKSEPKKKKKIANVCGIVEEKLCVTPISRTIPEKSQEEEEEFEQQEMKWIERREEETKINRINIDLIIMADIFVLYFFY